MARSAAPDEPGPDTQPLDLSVLFGDAPTSGAPPGEPAPEDEGRATE